MNQQALFYHVGRQAMRAFTRWQLETRVEYQAPIPEGPVILAPNHPTTLDPIVVSTLTNRALHFLVTESAFKVPALGTCLRRAGQIKVESGQGRAAFESALSLLKAGKPIAIFPEGALSPVTGGMAPAHTGVIRLALMTGAPIIPVGIAVDQTRILFVNTGIPDANGEPEVARLYLRGPYAVTVGKPVYLHGSVQDRGAVHRQTDLLMLSLGVLAYRSAVRLMRPPLMQPILSQA